VSKRSWLKMTKLTVDKLVKERMRTCGMIRLESMVAITMETSQRKMIPKLVWMIKKTLIARTKMVKKTY